MIKEKDIKTLVQVAKQSIEHGLARRKPLPVELGSYSQELSELAATFVTLEKNKRLRGCVGMIEPVFPLLMDVANNAYSAAFRDTRFRPVEPSEVDSLDIQISILSPLTEVNFKSEEELLGTMKPGVDGLVLSDGPYRGVFLPVVWEQLPEPGEFLTHLKMKAGLPHNHWSDTIQVWKFGVDKIS